MKQAITNLSKEESNVLNKLLRDFTIDQSTSQKTQRYYRELRRLCITNYQSQTYKFEDLMRAALIIAEKSQVIHNLEGHQIRGFGISLNQALKSCTHVPTITNALKIFLTHSKLLDQRCCEDITETILEIEFGSEYSAKIGKVFKHFQFTDKIDESYGYGMTFRCLTWLLFLDAKIHLSINEGIETDYLMISVFWKMIRYSLEFQTSKRIFQTFQLLRNKISKSTITKILDQLCMALGLKMKNQEYFIFQAIDDEFDNYFEQKLLVEKVLKCMSIDSLNFLNPEIININYKRMDLRYQKNMMPNCIDYRLFLQNRPLTLTPTKYTNVSHHLSKNNRKPQPFEAEKKRNFASHKILNFDILDCERSPEEFQKTHEIKLPSNVRISPSFIKTPLICATTYTASMEIQNYLNKKIKANKQILQGLVYQDILMEIEKIMSQEQMDDRKFRQKVMQAYNLYLIFSHQFFESFEVEQTKSLHYSLVAMAIELILFANSFGNLNSSNQNQRSIKFEDIVDMLMPEEMDIWMVCNFINKMDHSMPQKLKNHVTQIEYCLIGQTIWRSKEIITEIYEIENQSQRSNKDQTDNSQLLCLMKDVLKYIESQIKKITKGMSLVTEDGVDLRMKIEQESYNCMKYVITTACDLLYNRHLDQFILCSLYIATRTNQLKIRFNQIICSYEQTSLQHKSLLKDVINHVWVEDQEGEEQGSVQKQTNLNVIEFYNQIFVPTLKPFLSSIKNINFEFSHHIFQRKISEERNTLSLHQQNLSTNQRHSQKQLSKAIVKDLRHVRSKEKIYYNLETEPLIKLNQKENFNQQIRTNKMEITNDPRQISIISRRCEGANMKTQEIYRNDTAIRTRPPPSFAQGLCQTQKIKNLQYK